MANDDTKERIHILLARAERGRLLTSEATLLRHLIGKLFLELDRTRCKRCDERN